MSFIPFNRPHAGGKEFQYIQEAIEARHLSSGGPFAARCEAWLEERIGCERAVVVHSCTAALEMAALLLDVAPGDEVIMPSFTFVSTANAFVLRGATPVFVDIREDTLNLDETLVEQAITERTKAVVAVHYAGVACELDQLMAVCGRREIALVEDAAQGLGSSYRGRPLGSFGAASALSFHETKNVISGEGGALLVNDPGLAERALHIRDKGTNRQQFFRGEVDKYTWVDVGSSYGMSEINSAFLWAQLDEADAIRTERLRVWALYHDAFAELEEAGLVRRPVVPAECEHNAHMYYLLLRDSDERAAVLAELNAHGVNAVFHYVPLHDSPVGRNVGRSHRTLERTTDLSARLVRLPLWLGMGDDEVGRVVGAVRGAVGALR